MAPYNLFGNWKSNPKSYLEASNLFIDLISGIDQLRTNWKDDFDEGIKVAVFPPSIYHRSLALEQIKYRDFLSLGGQDVLWEDGGAFTGAISAAMLEEAGCDYTLIGHSERRQYFGVTDKQVNEKLLYVLENSDLIPVLCIGETLEQRENGETAGILTYQIRRAFKEINGLQVKFPIAYEPVWAIGTGLVADVEDIIMANAIIRSEIAHLYSSAIGDKVQILYGGSVGMKNIRDLLAVKDSGGWLIGGVSLKPKEFLEIVDVSLGHLARQST